MPRPSYLTPMIHVSADLLVSITELLHQLTVGIERLEACRNEMGRSNED